MTVLAPEKKIDWKAYYQRFREEHGHGVEYKDRVLFADGWMYSLTDYKGPEYHPPNDVQQLRHLQLNYWTIRLKIVSDEHNGLKIKLEGLRRLQEKKSIPIEDEETDFIPDVQGRFDWLTADIEFCNEHIQDLSQ